MSSYALFGSLGNLCCNLRKMHIVADASSGPKVVLAHGAGSHLEHPTLLWLSEIVREAGGSVVRFNFGYREAGKSMPDRMPKLVEEYREVVREIQPAVIGGHSMGGRVASMLLAEEPVASGLLLFGYPLHPPDKPHQLRADHLPKIQVPVLQLSGTEDEFCRRDLMEEVHAGLDHDLWRLTLLNRASHSYSVKKSSGSSKIEIRRTMLDAVRTWLRALQVTENLKELNR